MRRAVQPTSDGSEKTALDGRGVGGSSSAGEDTSKGDEDRNALPPRLVLQLVVVVFQR